MESARVYFENMRWPEGKPDACPCCGATDKIGARTGKRAAYYPCGDYGKAPARYINEATFRLNEGDVRVQSLERLTSLTRRSASGSPTSA